MCTAGQRVSLTITGPGPSFFFSFVIGFVSDTILCPTPGPSREGPEGPPDTPLPLKQIDSRGFIPKGTAVESALPIKLLIIYLESNRVFTLSAELKSARYNGYVKPLGS